MSTSPTVLTSVRWNELFPWLILVRAARVALMVRVIALAMVGVVLTQLGWAAIDRLVLGLAPEAKLVRLTDRQPPRLWEPTNVLVLRGPLGSAAVETSVAADGAGLRRLIADRLNPANLFEAVDARRYSGPAARGWAWAMQPFSRMVASEGWRQWVGYLLAGLWAVAVWALFGGAISRIAALYLTRGETLGPLEALSSAGAKWLSTTGAPLFCLIVIGGLAAVLSIAGFMIRLDIFAVLIGLAWIKLILAGVAIAIVGIGLFVGWPLMWSTVAVERTDAFDGISRGYAYVYQRPLHLAFYLLAICILGLLAQAAVSIFTDASLKATFWAVERGAGTARLESLLDPSVVVDGQEVQGYMAWAGGKAIRFWTLAALWIAASFPLAYLWPAATGAYLLLRRLIDSTEIGEAAFDDGPPAGGLPTLVTDPGVGVPHVASGAPDSASP
jgi:hypothetical protein